MPLKQSVKQTIKHVLQYGGILAVVICAFLWIKNNGMSFKIGKVTTVSKVKNFNDAIQSTVDPNVKLIAFPTTHKSTLSSVENAVQWRFDIWEWNAMMGFLYSNGGVETTTGSLMEKQGVNLNLTRTDPTDKMQADILTCALEIDAAEKKAIKAKQEPYTGGCSTGANVVIIMLDGLPQFAAQLNTKLLAIGKDWGLETIGIVGFSAGEDAFLAPKGFRDAPHKINQVSMFEGDKELPTKGLLIGGVLRDGDWNIALKFAGDNGLKNNPTETTFDPDALNWMNEPDYNVAAADFNANKCEDRILLKDGKPVPGPKVRVCMNGVVTWTPGDVTAVEGRGAKSLTGEPNPNELEKVVSSADYASQMASGIVGPKHFFDKHSADAAKIILAAGMGADQIKSFQDKTLPLAARISATVYGDQGGDEIVGKDSRGRSITKPYTDGRFWSKYYVGATENGVNLGGSRVSNLADNRVEFGLDGPNIFAATYNVFSQIDLDQYPRLFRTGGPNEIPPVASMFDVSFIKKAAKLAALSDDDNATGGQADAVDYTQAKGTRVIGNRVYDIDFIIGTPTPTESGKKVLEGALNDIILTKANITVDGFTDVSGNAASNMTLSQGRAEAVRAFLQARGTKKQFPDSRFAGVVGHGNDTTYAEAAKNRRVTITLKD